MRVLASFIMQGRSQAAVAAAGLAVTAWLVPPLSLLSSASLGLVTLREGITQALIVAALASLGLGLISLVVFGHPGAVLVLALLLWLPMLSLGAVLRSTRSLAATIESALAICILVVAFYLVWEPDPTAQWRDLVAPIVHTLGRTQQLTSEQESALLEQVLQWMTGAVVAGFFLQMILSLFLARWWQAMLYNPGGFGIEFRLLRLHKFVAYGGLLLMLPWWLGSASGGDWARSLGLVLASAFVLQGLAVVHGLLAGHRLRFALLTALYVTVLLAMPYPAMLLALLGMADTWVDVRARLAR